MSSRQPGRQFVCCDGSEPRRGARLLF